MLNVIGMILLTHQQATFRLNFFAPYHGWNCCDTASAQFKAHNGQRQLDGELIIDSPWLFPVAASNLQGHTVHILDGIRHGNKALVVGLAGIRNLFFKFTFEGNLCLAYSKSWDPTPAAWHLIDEMHHSTRQGGQHTTVYFNPI